MSQEPWPTCAKCQRPVEKMEWWDNELDHERVISAICHGEKETVILPFGLFESIPFESGIAFERYAMPEGQLRIEA